MTKQEAIENIKLAQAEVEWNYPMDYAAAFDVAIEALEKQIPKKPIETEEFFCGCCPNCSRYIDDDYRDSDDKFCKYCGQAVDWSED